MQDKRPSTLTRRLLELAPSTTLCADEKRRPNVFSSNHDASVELPTDVWMMVADYLYASGSDKNESSTEASALLALSETSFALNLACSKYLENILLTALSPQSEYEEGQFHTPIQCREAHHQGNAFNILRRLMRHNSTAAHLLLNQYYNNPKVEEVGDRDNGPCPVPLERCAQTAESTTIRRLVQQQLAETAQQANLRLRQLSDDFAARLLAQRERLLFWTRTVMGCILVGVMMTTCLTAANNVTTSHSNMTQHHHAATLEDDELHLDDASVGEVDLACAADQAPPETCPWMLVRLFLGVLFSAIVAWGVSRQGRSSTKGAIQTSASRASSPRRQPNTKRCGTTSKKQIKRCHSVGENLVTEQARNDKALGHSTLELLDNRCTQLALRTATNHHLVGSSSTPNLQRFLLMDDDDESSELILSPSQLWPEDEAAVNMLDDEEPACVDPLLVSNDALLLDATPVPTPQCRPAASYKTQAEHVHGCVGSYHQVVASAKRQVINAVKDERQRAFESMNPDDRVEYAAAFLDACTSDDSLDEVKSMCRSLPVDDFFVGLDGMESCALHTAAFHGATQVLDFLCRGIDETCESALDDGHQDLYNDGGLCQVNTTDANGWTALHFAASSGNVEAVRILVLQHGADLNVQAVNGYTPWQWAQRLQKVAVATELRRLTILAARTAQQQRRLQLLHRIRQHMGSMVFVAVLLAIPNFALLLVATPP